jgi:CubicO group peptidase (beta-lactamase class C family)
MTRGIDVDRIRARVSELLAEYRIPSAAIGALHEGEITEFAVGLKNLSTQELATTETIYQCGSMTKTWTALAFMQLVDERKIALDEPVLTYLPGFRVADPEVSARVTPRHLLNHTSGIEEAYGNPGEDDDVYERMVEDIVNAPQVHPLGHTHGYSAALGYAMLARIMEVIDGKRWDGIMKVRLFDALGLTSTSSWREHVDQGRAATGHLIRSVDEGPFVSPLDYLPRAFGPGGNVNSTVRDVLAMAHVFLNGGKARNGTRIVSVDGIREMMESRVPIPDPYMFGPAWALGLIVCDWHGETVYATDGSTIGQSARLRILPDSNIAIAMLANGGPRERDPDRPWRSHDPGLTEARSSAPPRPIQVRRCLPAARRPLRGIHERRKASPHLRPRPDARTLHGQARTPRIRAASGKRDELPDVFGRSARGRPDRRDLRLRERSRAVPAHQLSGKPTSQRLEPVSPSSGNPTGTRRSRSSPRRGGSFPHEARPKMKASASGSSSATTRPSPRSSACSETSPPCRRIKGSAPKEKFHRSRRASAPFKSRAPRSTPRSQSTARRCEWELAMRIRRESRLRSGTPTDGR